MEWCQSHQAFSKKLAPDGFYRRQDFLSMSQEMGPLGNSWRALSKLIRHRLINQFYLHQVFRFMITLLV